MKTDPCDTDALDHLRDILSAWNEHPEAQSQATLDAFIRHLNACGWTRLEVYELLQRTCSPAFAQFSQSRLAYVADVETAVIGHVAPAAIMRFSDDPVGDLEQLAQYVRSGIWRACQSRQMAQPMAYQYANMLNIAAAEFSFDDVERFFRSDDCVWKFRPIISRSSSTCDLRMSVQSGGVHPAAGVLYRPVNSGGRGFDHLFTSNMADGWESLLVSLSAHANKDCISIRCDEQKIREFKIIRAGAIVRVVQAIRDGDRWEFCSAGEALGFEERDLYTRRVKKDRLPLELLVRYFKCCSGFDLSDQNTFRSERELLQLVERRR